MASLPGLRAFEAVARLGSVRQAAAELHVTPGAVSQQVKALEAEIGAALVQRHGTGLVLTRMGQEVKDDLAQAFRLLGRVSDRLRRGMKGLSLRLRIEDPALAANWLLTRLQRYRARADSVDVVLETATSWATLEPDAFDFDFRFGLGDWPDVVAHRLFADEVYPVFSPKVLARAPLTDPADLKHHTLLHLDWSGQSYIWPDWQAWLRAAGIEDVDATRGIHFTDFALCLQAAVAGQGVALGTTGAVADLLAEGRLICPFEKSITTPFAYYIVHAPDVLKRPEAQAFLNWILEEAKATEI
ncbi:LysR family glycine cleavage system transcriptional activator [Dongia mobilis]|uniref:LysR family glycine cleavage system transcriptional activator n=1 Tax=Dongia mobilis TaxID=578943 RepID=A0A4R6WJW6_9PROT|nr:LysR substrate-binding domain-containing protein [Dongia mobilis]TDQ80576.1 LysR family glycine cleavage system transcriptional activator [Dongia mobilis]